MTTNDQGSYDVASDVMDYVRADLPPALAYARQRRQIPLDEMPDVEVFLNEPVEVMDTWPLVFPEIGRVRNFRQTDLLDGGREEYEADYEVRLFLWVRFQEYRQTLRFRDRYQTVLQNLMLAKIGLGSHGRTVLRPDTLDVLPSDATRGKGDRYLAASQINFTVRHTQVLQRVPLGYAAETALEATLLQSPQPDEQEPR